MSIKMIIGIAVALPLMLNAGDNEKIRVGIIEQTFIMPADNAESAKAKRDLLIKETEQYPQYSYLTHVIQLFNEKAPLQELQKAFKGLEEKEKSDLVAGKLFRAVYDKETESSGQKAVVDLFRSLIKGIPGQSRARYNMGRYDSIGMLAPLQKIEPKKPTHEELTRDLQGLTSSELINKFVDAASSQGGMTKEQAQFDLKDRTRLIYIFGKLNTPEDREALSKSLNNMLKDWFEHRGEYRMMGDYDAAIVGALVRIINDPSEPVSNEMHDFIMKLAVDHFKWANQQRGLA